MAINQQNPSRVHLNRLLSRYSANALKGQNWLTTTIQWAFPDKSLELYTTTSTTQKEPGLHLLVTPNELPTTFNTQLDDFQADEPLPSTTASPGFTPPTSTHCFGWATQLSGLRIAVGLSVALSLLLALGLVYVVWLYYRLQHSSHDEETGMNTYHL